eukprot:3940841-Rhodomonas_salina.8
MIHPIKATYKPVVHCCVCSNDTRVANHDLLSHPLHLKIITKYPSIPPGTDGYMLSPTVAASQAADT